MVLEGGLRKYNYLFFLSPNTQSNHQNGLFITTSMQSSKAQKARRDQLTKTRSVLCSPPVQGALGHPLPMVPKSSPIRAGPLYLPAQELFRETPRTPLKELCAPPALKKLPGPPRIPPSPVIIDLTVDDDDDEGELTDIDIREEECIEESLLQEDLLCEIVEAIVTLKKAKGEAQDLINQLQAACQKGLLDLSADRSHQRGLKRQHRDAGVSRKSSRSDLGNDSPGASLVQSREEDIQSPPHDPALLRLAKEAKIRADCNALARDHSVQFGDRPKGSKLPGPAVRRS